MPMIPKIIHYCWFGKGDKPLIFERCLASWKHYMPDCEIIEWNEENTDLSVCPFLEEAYNSGKWAFVSDVVRLLVVYKYGGIYLDTDVELYQSFDDFMENEAFFFFQNHNQINTGLGFGAQKNNPLVKSLLLDYFGIEFSVENMNALACPIKNTAVIQKFYDCFHANNITQYIDKIAFFSFEEYCRIAHHYGEFSWKDKEQASALKYAKKTHKFWKFREPLRNPQIFTFFEQHRLDSFSRIYRFFVYDLIDYGLIYWVVRIWQKIAHKIR